MALPRIIEYLLSVNLSSPIVQIGFNTTVGNFPPGASVSLTNQPLGSNYGLIVYESFLDPRMVPDAFDVSLIFAGNSMFSGLVNGWVTKGTLDGFVLVTAAQPGTIIIKNVTNLNQLYSGAIWFVTIATAIQWKEVLNALDRLESPEADALSAKMKRVTQ
jgi:hypothetical protein